MLARHSRLGSVRRSLSASSQVNAASKEVPELVDIAEGVGELCAIRRVGKCPLNPRSPILILLVAQPDDLAVRVALEGHPRLVGEVILPVADDPLA